MLYTCESEDLTLRDPGVFMETNEEGPIRCKQLTIDGHVGDDWKEKFMVMHQLVNIYIRKATSSECFDLRGCSVLKNVRVKFNDNVILSLKSM